ncbi:MAG: hypothetical protein MJ132_06025 [Clostridia bacterium]|nr:hypothetical protein [Clostridia bacterium]
MLRTINYTFSKRDVRPSSPQFAGVQGENLATELVFEPTADMAEALADLRNNYDTLYYRFDCIDGIGRTVTGAVAEYIGGNISFLLPQELTEAGGELRVCLIISGENNEASDGTRLFSYPASLYFKDFPLRLTPTERGDLNHAVKQMSEMRAEVYDLVQTAQEICNQNNGLLGQISETVADTRESAERAASYAGGALTSCVTASGYAESARKSATEAADSLAALLATVGNINAVLQLLVDAA